MCIDVAADGTRPDVCIVGVSKRPRKDDDGKNQEVCPGAYRLASTSTMGSILGKRGAEGKKKGKTEPQ